MGMLSFSSRAELFAASARGFDVLMRLIVAAAANEITMSCGRLAAGPPRGGHRGGGRASIQMKQTVPGGGPEQVSTDTKPFFFTLAQPRLRKFLPEL